MPVHVLGISAFYHDAAACLLRDGLPVLAIQEERLSRIKHDRSFPVRAIAACLEASGVGPGEVDAVVFYEKTFPKLERQLETWVRAFPRSLRAFVRSMSRYLDGRVDLRSWLRSRHGLGGEILFSEHHLSHAALAFYSSPFDEADVLVADGVGEWATTSVWRASGAGIHPVRELHFPDSLGLFYSMVTAHLGFRVNEDEYKVMGLASYGDDSYREEMASVLALRDDGSVELDRRVLALAGQASLASPELARRLGPSRAPGAAIEKRHMDLAKSAQARLEDAMDRIAAGIGDGRSPLCLSGGVALNGGVNARLSRTRPVHVPFAPGDAGGAIGAAFVGWTLALGNPRPPRFSPYLGPSFDDPSCERALRAAGFPARRLEEVGGDRAVIDAIAAGRVVGWFDGRMEMGPRALGHRSILADARRAEIRDVLNARIKHREPFRPFAPAVPAERAAAWFDVEHDVPWMTEVVPARPQNRDRIAAVVHIDGTSRVQTVRRDEEPRFHALLEAFGEATGVPVLLNTSFNVAGEPIVCTPEDALLTFRSAGLDALVLGSFWVAKEP